MGLTFIRLSMQFAQQSILKWIQRYFPVSILLISAKIECAEWKIPLGTFLSQKSEREVCSWQQSGDRWLKELNHKLA